MPKVSVIIPTYNRERFVTKAIDSVLKQGFKDYEIIVIDDGSTDATRKALEPYMSKIKYIYQENSGVSSARNAGITLASGEWISFLDSDDEWTAEYLSTQMASIKQFPHAVAHITDAVSILLDGTRESLFTENGLFRMRKLGGNQCLLLERPLRTMVQHRPWFLQSSIVRKEILLQAGLFDTELSIAEDVDLLVRVALKGPFTFSAKELVMIIRRQETVENLTESALKDNEDRYRSFSKVYANLFTYRDLRVAEKRAIAGAAGLYLRALGGVLFAAGEKSEARKLYTKSLLIYPSVRSAARLLASYFPDGLSRAARLGVGEVKRGAKGEAQGSTQSYFQILRSTAILGGSSAVNVIMRIIRTKFLAIFLGPSGIGLLGVYTSITDMGGAAARMGIDSSGVRQIAEGTGNGNEEKLARILFALRRVSLFFGVLGMVLLISLSHLISRVTFQNTAHTSDLIFLSVGILLETIVAGEVARLQGMRRIGDLAKVSVLSAVFGTFLTILVVYVFGQKGIVFFLIASSAASMVIAWWYASKIRVSGVRTSWTEIRTEVRPLLKLGFAVMVADLMGKGTGYFLRVLVLRKFGLAGSGLFQVGMTLSSIYIGFILESMVKDYYPRLTAIANDPAACNKLVNEQVEVGTLIAVPGILAMLTFAPIIIPIFYTTKFAGAFEIFRWATLGMLLRVASWPLGFILQAKGRAGLYVLTDILMNVAYVALVWAGLSYFGLDGAGIGFFGMCVFYWIMIYGVVKFVTGFSWSEANVRNALLFFPAVGIVVLLHLFLGQFWTVIVGTALSAALAFYSLRTLVEMATAGGLVPGLRNIKERFGATILS